MARNLTDKGVQALRVRDKMYAHPDPALPGHYIRVRPSGSKMFVAVTRDPRGKQVWTTIGSTALYSIEEAREKARDIIKRIKAGKDKAGPQSFEAIAKQWLHRHVDTRGLRTANQIRSILHKHILPEWGGREFESIRRGDVAALMDKVEDGVKRGKGGARTADLVLEIISGITHWYEKRNDDYTSPIVRGMKRYRTKEHARDRVLSDDEIRKLWAATENGNGYGTLARLCLLTAQRRDKVASMRWDDISEDGTWTIPSKDREKTNAGELVLPKLALAVINARPRFEGNPYVIAARNAGYISHTTNRDFGIPDYRIHDLRRTAKSLMARAGIPRHVSERVLGHAIGGVEGTYDRHPYREEKAHALASLASLIEEIVNGNGNEKVVKLRG